MTPVLRERDPQLTAEKMGGAPQARRETVVAMSLVPRARVQHRRADQIEDAPQSPEETLNDNSVLPSKLRMRQNFLKKKRPSRR